MKKRPALLISIALTFFLFVVAGALAVRAANSGGQLPFLSSQANKTESAALLEREAAYQALIEQANQQLEQAKATQQALTSQLAAANENGTSGTEGISPEYAAEVARAVAVYPDTLKDTPELVSFEGQIAYEVQFEKGAIYVNALTGEVLLNGTRTLEMPEIDTEAAVKIATDYLGLKDIYQADEVTISGTPLYRIIFSAGHFVYVDHAGQIVYVQMVSQATGTATSGSNFNDDHQEDDHDDDDDDEHEEEDD